MNLKVHFDIYRILVDIANKDHFAADQEGKKYGFFSQGCSMWRTIQLYAGWTAQYCSVW